MHPRPSAETSSEPSLRFSMIAPSVLVVACPPTIARARSLLGALGAMISSSCAQAILPNCRPATRATSTLSPRFRPPEPERHSSHHAATEPHVDGPDVTEQDAYGAGEIPHGAAGR